VANISITDKNIQNQTSTFCNAISPVLGEKFGELWSTNHEELVVKSYPPKSTFRKTICWPLEGAAPPNFYTC